MGRKHTMAMLPDELKQALIQKIIERKQSENDIFNWLNMQGYSFSSSAFGRYCSDIKAEFSRFGVIRAFFALSPAKVAKHFDHLSALVALYALQCELELRVEMLEDVINNAIYED